METFIELVKDHPCLYDTSHEDYLKTKVKEEVWNKIARKLKCPTGEAVKTQWRKLRDCHRDALRRYKAKEKNGEITPLSKQWMYLKQMEFLLPYSKKKREPSPSFAENVQVEVLEINENSIEVGETVQLESSNNCDELIDDESHIPTKVQKLSDHSSVMKEALNHIKKRSSERDLLKRKYYPQDNDSLLQFFMSMYHTTKAMPFSSQLKIKRGIFEVVTEEEEKFVSSPERSTSGTATYWVEDNTFGDHQYVIPAVNEDI